ncbi:hypothetical protein Tco_0581688 [Tanacetum coccineum]
MMLVGDEEKGEVYRCVQALSLDIGAKEGRSSEEGACRLSLCLDVVWKCDTEQWRRGQREDYQVSDTEVHVIGCELNREWNETFVDWREPDTDNESGGERVQGIDTTREVGSMGALDGQSTAGIQGMEIRSVVERAHRSRTYSEWSHRGQMCIIRDISGHCEVVLESDEEDRSENVDRVFAVTTSLLSENVTIVTVLQQWIYTNRAQHMIRAQIEDTQVFVRREEEVFYGADSHYVLPLQIAEMFDTDDDDVGSTTALEEFLISLRHPSWSMDNYNGVE